MKLAALVLYWLLCVTATHVPVPHGAESLMLADKLAHCVMYCGLALLFGLRFNPGILAALILATYGVADELTQPYFGRSAELLDWVADLTGIITGLLLSRSSSVRNALRNVYDRGRKLLRRT